MTKKEFKESLLKGLGRCYLELKKDPMKYYDIILWACSHEISWDPQSEGTHSSYIYSLINCFEDKEPFLKEIITKFTEVNENSWMFLYYAEILDLFSKEENDKAIEALDNKYHQLYEYLLNLKEIPENEYLHQRDDYENLCVIRSHNENDFLCFANDVGYILENNKLFSNFDFEFFIVEYGKKYFPILLEMSKQNKYLYRFYNEYKKLNEDTNKIVNEYKNDNRIDKKNTEMQKKYLQSKKVEEKIDCLRYFMRNPFLSDIKQVIIDSESDDDDLKYYAIKVLEKTRSDEVYDWVKNKIKNKDLLYLSIYIYNYHNDDLDDILSLLNGVQSSFLGDDNWHDIVSTITDMIDTMKVSEKLLYFVYENSYCGNCKAKAFKELKRRDLLTDEMKQEYKYDANEEVRN